MQNKTERYALFDASQHRKDIKTQLQSMVLNVTFTKADGTLRDMRCTLIPECLPPIKNTKKVEKENEETMIVFDLEASDWRSFRMDSIKRITVG